MRNPKYKGNPQIEEGYTKFSNELLESILKKEPKLLTESGRVFFAIIRLIYGYNEKSKYIKNQQIQELTDMKPPNVTRSLNALMESNIIIRDNKNGETRINKHYREWELSRMIKNKVITRDNSKLSPVITRVITRDNPLIYKENLKKNIKERGAKKPPLRSIPEIKKCFESYGIKGEESTAQATLFFNHHEALNWMKGKTPIVDWRPLVYNWILRDRKNKTTAQNSLNIGAPVSTPAQVDYEPKKAITEIEIIQAEIDRIEGLEYFRHITRIAKDAKTIKELEKKLDPPTVRKLMGYRNRLEFLKQELKELKEKNND